MKDLRIFENFGYDLKDVILVDNATHCFGFQTKNGIPMVPFIDNKEDLEMIYLTHFLKELVTIEDVRPVLSKTFKLPQLRKKEILLQIDGVIEQYFEEVDDDFFLEDTFQNIENEFPKRRETFSE
mmetsp:Transcript_22778/g.20251  ORF Transcript_22778/g.20251 Transcript_22778/m.20251 type:complete len:125 (+) Transcript_22778:139-513(+)